MIRKSAKSCITSKSTTNTCKYFLNYLEFLHYRGLNFTNRYGQTILCLGNGLFEETVQLEQIKYMQIPYNPKKD